MKQINFDSMPISKKIQYSVIGVILLVLFISAATFMWTSKVNFHKSAMQEISVFAKVLAVNSSAAVAFEDKESATRILSAIRENPNILSAVIYKKDTIFAVFPTGDISWPNAGERTLWFDGKHYYAQVDIMTGNNVVGRLMLKSHLDVWTRVWRLLVAAMASLLGIVVVLTFIMSRWLKKHVSQPLVNLSNWATNVSESKSFAARAEKTSDDEIGRLAESLNVMLAELSKQESIISLNESLQKEIKVRKKTEKELISLRDKAESANRSKSAFLANMSHEIRTPMNAIIGFIDIVLEGDIAEAHKKHLQTVRLAAKDLHSLLNDILDVAKLEEGKLSIEQVPFSLKNLVQHVIKTFEWKTNEKGLQMIERINSSVVENYIGDPLRINQILTNIVGNAVKFTSTGSITIAVDKEDDDKIRFTVRDTGIGIPKEKLPHIFDSFIQADSSTSRRYGGTGLGTAISKQLVELMGGKIWVESEEGIGSTFYFTVDLPETTNEEAIELCGVKSELLKAQSSLNVLVAEDVEQNAELLRIRLESLGHNVTHARNGLEALALYKENNYDIILMDIQMPEMDGLTATEEIRRCKQGDRIPILALTASVLYEDQIACRAVGMDGFVKKPIVFNELFSEMSKVLSYNPQLIDAAEKSSRERRSVDNGITYIDFATGKENWGDSNVYIKNLKSFANTHCYACTLLRSEINNSAISDATRRVHALKGVAGNLALTDLFSELKVMHEYLKGANTRAAIEHLDILQNTMDLTLAAINNLTLSNDQNEEAVAFSSNESILTYIAQLEESLARGGVNENLLEKVFGLLRNNRVAPSAVSKFKSAVDNFEFDVAIDNLKRIKEEIGG